MHPVPVIDLTDLYHPYQDPGDNFDLLTAYALPEIDLQAVLLDATQDFRVPLYRHPLFGEMTGPRDPGVIPVTQCNYLFGRNIPYGIGPFRRMKTPHDPMTDISAFHNAVPLLLNTLEKATEPVHILCFGSARILAAAYNQNPSLLLEKTACVHLSAGSSGAFLEWNVELDPCAFVCLLRSELPLAIYPCAGETGPFDRSEYNTFWKHSNMTFLKQMDPPLRRYLAYAFGKAENPDFLRGLEEDVWDESIFSTLTAHNVWETAIWMQVANRTLVSTETGYRYLSAKETAGKKVALQEELLPCHIEADDSGLFTFRLCDAPSRTRIYHRSLPDNLELMLEDALSALYLSYRAALR